MTEFQSRRELREAERQGLVPKPEQVFDLPTGQIKLPEGSSTQSTAQSQDLASVNEMLTRKRIREMERLGLLDPLTGAVPVSAPAVAEPRTYDSVLAETEEPITASIGTIEPPIKSVTIPAVDEESPAPTASTLHPKASATPNPRAEAVAPTDIFHEMAVDINARKPRLGIILAVILVVLAGLGVTAYMLGIFK